MNAETSQYFINPLHRPFKLGEGADRGFINDQMCAGFRPFGAVLLIAEHGAVADAGKDFGERGPVRDGRLSLDAYLVAAG